MPLEMPIRVSEEDHYVPEDVTGRPDPQSAKSEAVPASTGETAGDQIDRYTLVDELGEGGMGTVWRASQSEPVRREVALKIIKWGMDTREVVARFEAERQALALMDHPHIAKVFDGGATDSGRPYFVMELVEGVPITTFCDDHQLDVRQRLELFIQVCAAIQHAHQKGIIHRDIKPSNVLIALRDDGPVPKVIDFGIAKATNAALTQQTVLTQHSQIIGTPEYMAPEQAAASGLDIDTRADVYSLGVLLYELLTGSKPFDLRSVLQLGYEELIRTIREVDPERPSTRVSTHAATATALPRTPSPGVASLSRQLRGDLDWIVMNAIEKDRTRRYETANGLGEDVARYLNEEPVLAAPPSAGYRLRKLIRRRRKTVAAVAAIVLLLVAGSIGTGIGLWRTIEANRELDTALSDKGVALDDKNRAYEERGEALTAKTRALDDKNRALQDLEQVVRFQSDQLLELDAYVMGSRLRDSMLEEAPEGTRESLTKHLADLNFTSLALRSLKENFFDRSLAAIDTRFADQPLVRAQLLQTTADNLLKLGLFERAADPQERALAIRRAELGDEHPDTLASINRKGLLLSDKGLYTEAEAWYREAYEARRRVLGDDAPDTLKSLSNVAHNLYSQGKLKEAETLHRDCLERRRRTLGDDAIDTLYSLNNLGLLLDDLGRYEEAEACLREALAARRRLLGNDDLSTLTSAANLGSLLRARDKPKEAERYLRASLEGCRRTLGNENTRTLFAMNNMASLLKDQKKFEDAEPLYHEALEGMRKTLGPNNLHTLTTGSNLAGLIERMGRLTEAEPYRRQGVERMRRTMGSDHPTTLLLINNLAYNLRDQGRDAEAEPLFFEALRGLCQVLGKDHPNTQMAANSLRDILNRQVAAARQAGDTALLAERLTRNGNVYLLLEGWTSAETTLAEALELLEMQSEPLTDSAQVLNDLGHAIAGQGRYEEAQWLLLESAETLLEGADAATATAVIQRVIDLYARWHVQEPDAGHEQSVEEWSERQQMLGG